MLAGRLDGAIDSAQLNESFFQRLAHMARRVTPTPMNTEVRSFSFMQVGGVSPYSGSDAAMQLKALQLMVEYFYVEDVSRREFSRVI